MSPLRLSPEQEIYILPNTRIVWVRPGPGLSLLQLPFLFISLILDPHKYNVPLAATGSIPNTARLLVNWTLQTAETGLPLGSWSVIS